MLKGKKQEINFNDYECYKFHIEHPYYTGVHGSCGTHALACLTGATPEKVGKKLPKHLKAWTDRRMLSFLKKKGFIVKPITINNVTYFKNRFSIRCHLTRFHVLLVSQHVTQHEGTWSVIWNNSINHSGQFSALRPLEFLNSPLWTVYLIWHPGWAKYRKYKDVLVKSLDMMESDRDYIEKYRRGMVTLLNCLSLKD